MKKVLLVLALCLVLGAAVFITAAGKSLSITTGYYLEAENGTHLLIDGNTPIPWAFRSACFFDFISLIIVRTAMNLYSVVAFKAFFISCSVHYRNFIIVTVKPYC